MQIPHAQRTSELPVLRPFTAADLPFLRILYRTSRERELAPLPWTEAQKQAFCDLQFDAQLTGYRNAFPGAEHLIICSPQGESVGRLITTWTAEGLRVIDISLLPDFRGRGWGARIIERQLEAAAARGLDVRLSVDKTNPALALYRRLGFAVAAEQGFRFQMIWTSREKNNGRSVSR